MKETTLPPQGASTRRAMIVGRKGRPPTLPPLLREMGLEIVEMGIDFVRLLLPAADDPQRAFGTVQGGMLCTLADMAMRLAIATRPDDEILVTLDLQMRFLQPVLEGAVSAEARVRHRGPRTAVCEVTLYESGHRLVAVGSCSCVRRELP